MDEQQQIDPRGLAGDRERHRRALRQQPAQPGPAAARHRCRRARPCAARYAADAAAVAAAGRGCRCRARPVRPSTGVPAGAAPDIVHVSAATPASPGTPATAGSVRRPTAGPPVLRTGAAKGRLLRERRPDPEQCVDALALGEAVPVKAEQAVQCAFGDAAQQAHLPAPDRRGDREAGQRVAEVMLAVAIGSLTVFPGLAPVHAGQCQEAAAGRQAVIQQRSQRRRQFAAHLQGMLVGTVVGEQRRRLQGTAGKQQVGFGGMQVAARRIDPQRPASAAGLLPGRQRQSVVEHLRGLRRSSREGAAAGPENTPS